MIHKSVQDDLYYKVYKNINIHLHTYPRLLRQQPIELRVPPGSHSEVAFRTTIYGSLRLPSAPDHPSDTDDLGTTLAALGNQPHFKAILQFPQASNPTSSGVF